MLFFEMGNCFQFTTAEPEFEGDRVHFRYVSHDSDEGEVRITYVNINGDDARATWGDPEVTFDVEITTGSDVWGLESTQDAINEAVKLHRALGRDDPNNR